MRVKYLSFSLFLVWYCKDQKNMKLFVSQLIQTLSYDNFKYTKKET